MSSIYNWIQLPSGLSGGDGDGDGVCAVISQWH